ncbi:MAG: adaptor protein MecA, partial [Oscillospiraceae bacterium]
TSRSNKIYKPCFDVPILCSFNSLSDAEKLSAFLKKDNSLIKSSLYKYLNKFLLLLYFPFSYDANMVVSEFCDIMLKGDIALSFAEEHANLLAKNNAVELLCL